MSRTSNILLVIGCAIAVTATIFITMRPTKTSALPENLQVAAPLPALPPLTPKLTDPFNSLGIVRRIQLKTQIQEDVSYDVTEYTVERGDSLWSIGQKFKLKPETILWGNEWLSKAGVLQVGDRTADYCSRRYEPNLLV